MFHGTHGGRWVKTGKTKKGGGVFGLVMVIIRELLPLIEVAAS